MVNFDGVDFNLYKFEITRGQGGKRKMYQVTFDIVLTVGDDLGYLRLQTSIQGKIMGQVMLKINDDSS